MSGGGGPWWPGQATMSLNGRKINIGTTPHDWGFAKVSAIPSIAKYPCISLIAPAAGPPLTGSFCFLSLTAMHACNLRFQGWSRGPNRHPYAEGLTWCTTSGPNTETALPHDMLDFNSIKCNFQQGPCGGGQQLRPMHENIIT